MSLSLALNQPFVSVGLPTWTYTVPSGAGGIYSVHVECSEAPPSGISILVKNNGSTVFTVPVNSLSPTQNSVQAKSGPLLLAAADVVTVVMASAEAIDNQLNTVKTTCTLQQGA